MYRARDTRLDRDVAIKVLPEGFADDADRLSRFQREARTLASLNHPNIAAIYGLEEGGGPTALVMNRAHFLAVSAQAMRRILVDHARRHNAKRGARAEHVSLDAEAVMCTDRSDDFVSLDDALDALAERAQRKAQVVELRFFGGLSVEETAEVLHVSSITVMREWGSAKAWLYRELTGGTVNGSGTRRVRRAFPERAPCPTHMRSGHTAAKRARIGHRRRPGHRRMRRIGAGTCRNVTERRPLVTFRSSCRIAPLVALSVSPEWRAGLTRCGLA